MLLPFLMLAALSGVPADTEPNTLPDGNALIGSGAEALARETRSQCPTVPTNRLFPAALLDAEETFRDALPAAQRQAMERQLPQEGNLGPARCARRDSATCLATAYLEEIDSAGLLPRFVAGLCAPGAVR